MPYIKDDQYSRWAPDDMTGWSKVGSDSQECLDRLDSIAQNENDINLKRSKINLKIQIDAGNALGLDMSAEEAELDSL